MGIIKKGILGGFSGTVGNIVGGSWKGIDYLRILPASVANPKTQKQMDQRTKFITVIRFLQPLTDFVRIGFKAYAIRMTAFNAAMSYNFRHAIVGEYPNYSVDTTKVLLSRGALSGAVNVTCGSELAGIVSINWYDNSGLGNAAATDKAMVVIYNQADEHAIYVLDAASRSDGIAQVEVPSSFSGKEVHCYVGFTSLDELISTGGKKSISDSAYGGSVTVG